MKLGARIPIPKFLMFVVVAKYIFIVAIDTTILDNLENFKLLWFECMSTV